MPLSIAPAARKGLSKVFSHSSSAILIAAIYLAFRLEIVRYWNQLYTVSGHTIIPEGGGYPVSYWNTDLLLFKTIWVINYSLLFVSLLTIVNLIKIRSRQLGTINLVLTILTLQLFLAEGLYVLGGLRENYLMQTEINYYPKGAFHIGIRYVSFVCVALLLLVSYISVRKNVMQRDYRKGFGLLLHVVILWIASSEWIHWMEMARSTQSYKIGLSILWGLYSVLLIVLGIRQKKKYLRIGAIVLFGSTLVKLFLYDISHLNTIARTIVFVLLGVLLLIISFLYNKYKHRIADDVPER